MYSKSRISIHPFFYFLSLLSTKRYYFSPCPAIKWGLKPASMFYSINLSLQPGLTIRNLMKNFSPHTWTKQQRFIIINQNTQIHSLRQIPYPKNHNSPQQTKYFSHAPTFHLFSTSFSLFPHPFSLFSPFSPIFSSYFIKFTYQTSFFPNILSKTPNNF